MSFIRRAVMYLYNGGLHPEHANPKQLYERRVVSTTVFLLTPVALVLFFANFYAFEVAATENYAILVGVAWLWIALTLQARFGWTQVAANSLILAFWLVPTAFIIQLGLNSTNWAFYFVLSMLALLLRGPKNAAFWTTVALITLWTFVGLEQIGYMQLGLRPNHHSSAIAISGSLIAVMLFVAGATFRQGQKQAEERLQANVERLAEEVNTRRLAEESALAAERAKAVFLTTMSHELRTPLNGVIGAAQLMSNTKLDDEQQSLMAVVTSSGELLLELINNVLDLSKLEAGRLELDLRPCQPKALVDAVILPLGLMAANKGVAMNVVIAPDVPPWVLCDPLRIRQILLNLCGNALKFTDEGEIEVSVKQGNQGLEFGVRDSGVGISEQAQTKLFQPFTQADSSTARKYGGSGLGLNIVKQLVDLMHGSIALESVPGQGAKFTVQLPLQACEMAMGSVSTDTPVQRAATLRVLVTDDNPVNRMVAAKMIRRLSHEVLEAEDGQQALDAVQKGDVDVVLMDVQMPVMDGLSATDCIRKLPSPLNSTPIIGLSANAQASDRNEMLAAGMDEYLAKPVRLEQLELLLNDLPSRSNEREL